MELKKDQKVRVIKTQIDNPKQPYIVSGEVTEITRGSITIALQDYTILTIMNPLVRKA